MESYNIQYFVPGFLHSILFVKHIQVIAVILLQLFILLGVVCCPAKGEQERQSKAEDKGCKEDGE